MTITFRTLPMFPLQFNINAPMPSYRITPIPWVFLLTRFDLGRLDFYEHMPAKFKFCSLYQIRLH